jgi:hypothetical protein
MADAQSTGAAAMPTALISGYFNDIILHNTK